MLYILFAMQAWWVIGSNLPGLSPSDCPESDSKEALSMLVKNEEHVGKQQIYCPTYPIWVTPSNLAGYFTCFSFNSTFMVGFAQCSTNLWSYCDLLYRIDRQIGRQIDRQIERRTDGRTDRQTDRQTDGQRQTESGQRDTEGHRERHGETRRDTERQRETGRDRERQRETERERQRETERER